MSSQFTSVCYQPDELLDQGIVESMPDYCQERLRVSHEVRIIKFGDCLVAVARYPIYSSQGEFNIRYASEEAIKEMGLPEKMASGCMSYARRCDIIFAAFDFVVTPEGDWFFLEANEAGQFLWIENLASQFPMLHHFVCLTEGVSLSTPSAVVSMRRFIAFSDYCGLKKRIDTRLEFTYADF